MSWYAKKHLCHKGGMIVAGDPVPADVPADVLQHWHEQQAIAESPVVDIPEGKPPIVTTDDGEIDPSVAVIEQLKADLAATQTDRDTYKLAIQEWQRRMVEATDAIAAKDLEIEQLKADLAATKPAEPNTDESKPEGDATGNAGKTTSSKAKGK